VHHFIDSSRYLESLSSSITLYTSYDLAVVFVSIVSIRSLQHVMGNEQKKSLLCRLHLTSSTGTSNTKCPIDHLASSCISLLTEIALLEHLSQQNKLHAGEKRERQKDLIKNITTIPYLYVNIQNKCSGKWSFQDNSMSFHNKDVTPRQHFISI